MTAYRYEAVDAGGRRRRGSVEADSARRARQDLKRAGLTLLALDETRTSTGLFSAARKKDAKPRDVIVATRQLGTLIEASMPIEEALAAVAAQEEGHPIAATLTAVRGRVVEGWKLADALAEHPKSFNRLYVGIVAAGEASATLGPVMARLADMQERNRAILSKAVMSLIYPAVIAVVAVVVVWAMMRWVVPKITSQFLDMGVETLPLPTRVVVGISDFLGAYGWALGLAIIAGVAALVWVRRTPGPRRAMDRLVLRVPVFGPLSRELDAARFARTLSTLFASGTPLLDALRGAQRTVTNDHTRAELDGVLTGVREGASLSGAMRRAKVFPPMMSSMIAAGERASRLPDMLEKTADQMEAGFERTTTLALRLLEPAVIVSLALVVLLIMLAIMLPILQINTMALSGV